LIRSSTWDGAPPHHKFYWFHSLPSVLKEILTVKKENVYVMDMRLVYFICSLVHILETAFGGAGTGTVFLK